jgi:hypothetical protein
MPKGKVDGVLETEDLLVAVYAMATIASALFVAGAGVEALAFALLGAELSSNRLIAWAAVGAIVGGLVAAWRVGVDLLYTGEPEPTITVSGPEGPVDLPEQAELSYGIEVHVNRGKQTLIAHLLDGKERVEAIVIMRRVAGAMTREGAVFSKRGAAKHLGEDAVVVRDELVRLGLLAKLGTKKNSSYGATDAGQAFFALCTEDPFPQDPLSITID